MQHLLVRVTWQSEHLVELEDGADPADVARLLAVQANVKMVGYTAQPLDEAVDAAVAKILGSDADAPA